MTKNMGTADRAIRTVVALVIAVLYFTGRISGAIGIVLLLVAVMFLVTSMVGWCPGYLPCRFSTRGRHAGGGTSGGRTD
jgi:K+-transporting ATPase A subunit